MRNYWEEIINERDVTKEELFFKLRDQYMALLRHLYNDPKDIPAFRLYICTEQKTLEEGAHEGYPLLILGHRGTQFEEAVIRDISMIENFENSYTWYKDNVFIVFDFRETGISPLQNITAVYCETFFQNLTVSSLSKLRLSHMYENIISSGIVQFFYGFYRLDINLLQALSAMTYEGAYNNCKLYIPRFDTGVERRTRRKGLDVAFSDPIAFIPDNLRQIRKLMELSDKNVALSISENGKVRGITTQEAYPNECIVRIWGNLSWSITYEENRKVSYYNASYHIHTRDDAPWHLNSAPSLLPWQLSDEQMNRIETVILAAFRQHHGTIIMISDPETVESETKRLVEARRATGISPTDLYDTLFLVSHLTSIDGAVFMDTDCQCSCIGAILDGDVVTKGTPARGARFNSTVNYVKRRKELGQTFIGFVISEDGIVDAVSDEHVLRINLKTR